MTRILVVDDSPTAVHVLKAILERQGYEVLSASTGEDGLACAKSEQPDLILMDIVMPGLNGFQATRQLSRDQSTAQIPVIIVSTKDQPTDKSWGLRQGAKDYITKPIDQDELVAKIKSVLAA